MRPLPLGGGGLSPLASQRAERPRRLGRKGEGVALAKSTTSFGAPPERVSPSPRFSKLASSLRETPSPTRGEGSCLLVAVVALALFCMGAARVNAEGIGLTFEPPAAAKLKC